MAKNKSKIPVPMSVLDSTSFKKLAAINPKLAKSADGQASLAHSILAETSVVTFTFLRETDEPDALYTAELTITVRRN